jgi:hypothetical protein
MEDAYLYQVIVAEIDFYLMHHSLCTSCHTTFPVNVDVDDARRLEFSSLAATGRRSSQIPRVRPTLHSTSHGANNLPKLRNPP